MRGLHKLTVTGIKAAKAGRYGDGGGLFLIVDPSGAKRWSFIVWRNRKPTEVGLGSLQQGVTLAMARERAAECRRLVAEGRSPKEWRRDRTCPTFGTFAAEVYSGIKHGWRNDKYRDQWWTSLQANCSHIWDMSVADITTDDVLKVLNPIWISRPVVADRIRSRIERILSAAKTKGYRAGENPAQWRGHLDTLRSKRQRFEKKHHAAMPWRDLPRFIARLRARESMSNLALEFLIHTAARSGEVRFAVWSEFDHVERVWTLPPARMKAFREHRIPLSDRAFEIVTALYELRTCAYVFPGIRTKGPLSPNALAAQLSRMNADTVDYTVHGFRSSFKDWASEVTHFPNELSEAALAHLTGDAAERAYRRSDVIEKRREMMNAWSRHLTGQLSDNVVPLGRVGT